MLEHALPAIVAVFVWWFSTGLVLLLDRLPKRTFRWSVLGASILAIGAFAVLAHTRDMTTAGSAYAAFAAGLLLWAWNEMTFLFGMITGPRRIACPPDATGWRRFRMAAATVMHHELAIAGVGLAIFAATIGGANQIGLWTYGALWAMRLSTKLNIFLGAPNVTEEFLPDRLRYLETYFRRDRVNALFPFTVLAALALFAVAAAHAVAPGADLHQAVGASLVAAMIGLAILEHGFLVLPLPDAALWRWALGPQGRTPAPIHISTTEVVAPSQPRSSRSGCATTTGIAH